MWFIKSNLKTVVVYFVQYGGVTNAANKRPLTAVRTVFRETSSTLSPLCSPGQCTIYLQKATSGYSYNTPTTSLKIWRRKRLSTTYKNRYLHHWDNTFTFNRLGKHCAVVSHNNSVSNSISKYACQAWLQTPSNSSSCFNHLSSLLGTGWFQEQFWARFHNHTQINWRPNARSVFNSS